DYLQIDSKQIPLLEAPERHEDPPRRILYVLFKHKLMICVIFISLIAPTFLYLLFRTTEYTGSAKILINPNRDYVSLSPTSSGQRVISMSPSPDVMNTEMQIIKSPELAERLAADIAFPDDPNGKSRSEVEIRRDARRLRGLLTPAPVRATNLIQISVTSPY